MNQLHLEVSHVIKLDQSDPIELTCRVQMKRKHYVINHVIGEREGSETTWNRHFRDTREVQSIKMIGEVIILRRVGQEDLVRLIEKLYTHKMNLIDEKIIETNKKSHDIIHMTIMH